MFMVFFHLFVKTINSFFDIGDIFFMILRAKLRMNHHLIKLTIWQPNRKTLSQCMTSLKFLDVNMSILNIIE